MPGTIRKNDVCSGHGCFIKSTKISLLNGKEVEIKDLIGRREFYVYSYDLRTKQIVPGRGHSARITRKNQPLYKVILDNDEEIICTPDHKFLMKNGKYKEVKELKEDDSLMPLYRRVIKDAWTNRESFVEIDQYDMGYEQILQENYGWLYTHKMVHHYLYGEEFKLKTTHHRDFNSRNNEPENIVACENLSHFKYHGNNFKKQMEKGIHPFLIQENPMKRSECIKKMKQSMKFYWDSNKFKKDIKKASIKGAKKRAEQLKNYNHMKDPEYRKLMSETTALRFEDSKNRENLSLKLKKYFKDNSEAKVYCKKGGLNNYAKKKGFIDYDHMVDVLKHYRNNLSMTDKHIAEITGIRIETISKYLKQYNHKVKKIKFYGYSDVYCFTVDKYHNFALTAGIFVHNCFPPRISVSWSSNVFVNERNVEIKTSGGVMDTHCCPGSGCHGGVHLGSRNVFANGKSIQAKGDCISCGSVSNQCSNDVFIN